MTDTPPAQKQDQPRVEQRHREAYASEVERLGDKEYADRIRAGQRDSLSMIHAFARFERDLLASLAPVDDGAVREICERCQGNGEIVTDWERYRHPRLDDKGDEAVAECPDCNGNGEIERALSTPPPSPDISAVERVKAELADLIARYYRAKIGQTMAQAQHWMQNGKPLAVHHRVRSADEMFQTVVLFDPERRKLGWDCPFKIMEDWLKLADKWEQGKYPPSAELHQYRDPRFVAAALSTPVDRAGEWQDISTAPKDGTVLLLFARCKTATASAPVIGWHHPDLGWIETCFAPNSPVGIVPTYWMPRPEFPAIRSLAGREGA